MNIVVSYNLWKQQDFKRKIKIRFPSLTKIFGKYVEKSWQLHNFYIKIVSLYYMLLLPHIHIWSFLCVYYLEITVNLFLIVEINHKRVISLIHEISFWNKRKKWWVSQHEVYSCRYTHFFMLGKPLFSYVNVKIYLLCLMKILEIY